MNDYAAQICSRRMGEISSKVNVRFSEIQKATGLSFPRLFSAETEALEQTTAAAGATAASGSADLYKGVSGAALFPEGSFAVKPSSASGYDSLIDEVSGRYGVSPALIKAIVRAESGFNPGALSSKGAMGLMQLMPATADGLGITDAYDPAQNVDGGVRTILGHIIRYDGNVPLALAAYNCGQGTISKLGIKDLSSDYEMSMLPQETREYLQKIYSILSADGEGSLYTSNFFTPPEGRA